MEFIFVTIGFVFIISLGYLAFGRKPTGLPTATVLSLVITRDKSQANFIWKQKLGVSRTLDAPGQFTYAQKHWAYNIAKGCCENCKRKTIFGNPKSSDILEVNAVAFKFKKIGQCHHWIAWMHGGDNVKYNCGWLCVDCNQKFSDLLTAKAIHILYRYKLKIWIPPELNILKCFAVGEYRRLQQLKFY